MTHWLTAAEQAHWRAWLAMNSLLPAALDRDLRDSFDIGLGEYEILVNLSEAPDSRVRMADLAHATLASRSKLTHQVSRMERAGWVTRERCTEDARGQWAVLTAAGWELIRAAAPVHVESVRTRLLEVLGPADYAELGRLAEAVANPLRDLPGISAPIGSD